MELVSQVDLPREAKKTQAVLPKDPRANPDSIILLMTANDVHAKPYTVYSLVKGTDKQMTFTSNEVKNEEKINAFCGCQFISHDLIMVAILTKLVIMDLQLNEKKIIYPE